MTNKKLPWEAPDLGSVSSRDIEAEKAKEQAFGDMIEGGCWFSHVGGIHDMEEDYARRSGRSGTSEESPDVMDSASHEDVDPSNHPFTEP